MKKNQDSLDKITSRTRAAIQEVASLASSVDQSQISEERYASYANKFKTRFTDIASRAVMDTQRLEMLKPITDMVANEFGNKWGEKIANHIIKESKKAQFAAKEKAKIDDNQKEPANDNKDQKHGKRTNAKNNLNKANTRKIINQIIDEDPNLTEAEKRSLRKKTLSRLRESENEHYDSVSAPSNDNDLSQDKRWQANQEFIDFAKKYYLKSIVEIIKSGGDPNSFTSTVKILAGFELEILGKFISDLKSQYPKTSAGFDKFLEVINMPGEYVGKQISKGYKFSKRELLDYITTHHSASQSDYVAYKISKAEQAILNEVAKYSPSSNQVEVLKAAELIGIGKLAKNVLENIWKLLYKKNIIHKVANDNFDLSTFEGGLIKGSTSFPDLATANKYTKETLLKNKDAIESWLSNTQSPRTQGFLAEFNDVIGYGYNKNNQFFNSINKVNVVLKKTEDGFIVYTSHPIVDKVK